MWRRFAIAVVLGLATPAFAATPVLNASGLGPFRFGMTLNQVSAAAGRHLQEPKDPEEGGCYYVEPPQFPGVSFMMANGQLARIDVSAREIATVGGVRVGDLVEDVKRKLGNRLVDEPHHYGGPEDRYLTLRLSRKAAVRFETSGSKIDLFYLGGIEETQHVEGCL
jgi:hypothetical protein